MSPSVEQSSFQFPYRYITVVLPYCAFALMDLSCAKASDAIINMRPNGFDELRNRNCSLKKPAYYR